MSPIVPLSASILYPHPQNPRPRLNEAEVAELRASIEAHGQKQPCVVRPVGENGSKKYEVIIGHRRAFVGKLLSRDVPCIVEDLDDDEALALMLSDNRVRTDPDPFMESKAVDALLKKEGHTLQYVADLLGKSPKWVAQRANLRNLTKKSREALAKAGWPVSWLEDWARLAPEVQDAEVERVSWVRDPNQLKAVITRYLHVLGRAPWKLDDATICPKAGPCSSCPKQSLHAPGLFSEGEDQDVRKATCRDALCWKTKADAHVSRQLTEEQEKHPDLVVIAADQDARSLPCLKDQKVLHAWEAEKAKKGARNAVTALRISVDGQVTRTFVMARKTVTGPGKAKKPMAVDLSAKERLEASKARYAKRREARVLELLREAIENLPAPDLKVVMGLAVAYRLSAAIDAGTLKAKKTRFALTGKDWAAEAWERVKRPVVESLRSFNEGATETAIEEGRWAAGVLGVDLKALDAKSREEIPDARWWSRD